MDFFGDTTRAIRWPETRLRRIVRWLGSRTTSIAVFGTLLCAILVVYGRGLDAPFIFDDSASVLDNPSLVQLWPPIGDAQSPGPLNPPRDLPTSGRPLVNLSLAVNYQIGGLRP